MFRSTAHAKINLALHVTGKLASGYHELDTLVVFTDFGDRISLEETRHEKPHVSVEISGPFKENLSSGEGNLVSRAAILLAEAASHNDIDTRSVKIYLEKNLPIASGIGGGSADAAATLLLLKRYWRIDDAVDLFAIANEIGADVAMCLHSQSLRAQGMGDQITPLKLQQRLPILLVNPMVEVSTPVIFSKLQTVDNSPLALDDHATFPNIERLKAMRNDLEAVAISAEPVIGTVLKAIEDSGALLARMSGSGATCFGVFPSLEKAEQARGLMMRDMPDWWCVATLTKSKKVV